MLVISNSQKQVDKALEYIGEDYKRIPYLYADVEKYGAGTTENVTTWLDMNGDEIQGIYLLYFDCLHFYTKDNENYDINTFMEVLNNCKPTAKVVMIQEGIGQRIEEKMSEKYDVEKNYVIEMDHINENPDGYRSVIAGREDIEGIVDLLLIDDLYTSVFSRDVLLNSMLERFDDGFSRYVVVKDGEKIIATCSTYGETDKFALIGSVIVDPDYRRRGLAADTENYICKLMIEEGRTNIGFVNIHNTPSINLHLKIGWEIISTLYKFVLKQD